MGYVYGYTLIELITAISIAALLLALAVPSFVSTVRNNRGVANGMLAVIMLARSEAVRRDQYVSLCVSTDGASCATSGSLSWDQGYVMFVDSNNNGVLDSGETLIRTEVPLTKSSTITYTTTGNSPTALTKLTFVGLGQIASSQVGYFKVLPNQSGSHNYGERYLVLKQIGRAVVCDPTSDTNCTGS
ncbi:MAG: GspH/FimT family pseudopilin [Nevskia sp.]|nr:GspH/FimT family pseudopilin [Nevskia sp.]